MLPSSTFKDHGGSTYPPSRTPPSTHAETSSKTSSFSTAASYQSFLSLRVPSPSLPLTEMLELGRSRSEQSSNNREYDIKGTSSDTDRDSIATLVSFGDWISEQSRSRPPSLLPPAPRLYRHHPPPLGTDSVECRLISTKLSPIRDHRELDSLLLDGCKRVDAPLQTSEPHSQFKEIPFISQTTPVPLIRPATPVPSLTHSQPSASSLSALGGDSPTTARPASLDISDIPIMDASEMNSDYSRGISNTSQMPEHVKPHQCISKRRNVTSSVPFQVHHDERPAARPVPLPDSAMKAIYPEWHSLADTAIDASNAQLPRQPAKHEFSHIDWDDDETDSPKGASRIARMKKSISELRAAERFISDANSRRKLALPKPQQVIDGLHDDRSLAPLDHNLTPQQRHAKHKNGHTDARYATYPRNLSSTSGTASKQIGILVPTPAKLKKQPSRKSILPAVTPPPASTRIPTQCQRDRRRTISSELQGTMPSPAPVMLGQGPPCDTSPAPVRSKSKRKRGSASTSRSVKSDRKKLTFSSTMSKWVRKVLGSRKETSEL